MNEIWITASDPRMLNDRIEDYYNMQKSIYVIDDPEKFADSFAFKFMPRIKRVLFNPPATIVFWNDDTKTVVVDTDGDWEKVQKAKTKKSQKEKLIRWKENGILNAIAKKLYHNYQREFETWIDELC